MSTQLQFAPFCSTLDGGFWHKLSQLKLDVFGLDDKLQTIYGFYTNGNSPGVPCCMNLDYAAFDQDGSVSKRCFRASGYLQNTNTIAEFKNCDKRVLLETEGSQLWDDITSGKAINEPELLSRFFLLTFADLKKFHYYYWFAFPALALPEVVMLETPPIPLGERFTEKQVHGLLEAYDKRFSDKCSGYFLVKDCNGSLEIGLLSDFDHMRVNNAKVLLAFCDACNLESHPGWSLRNLLALAAHHWADSMRNGVEVICFRDRFKDGCRSVAHSIVLKLQLGSLPSPTERPKCVGWEKNDKFKLGPRLINLSASMDPAKLAASAVDLNLKLMRWRLLPNLDLEKLSGARCLLLGAGTLGCNVARNLLGWGVRHITLVDNGTVSYSNPVRQSLFVFEDSLNGGKPKAQAAADALIKIFPGVNATGLTLSIPMPGHTVSESTMEQVKCDVRELEELIAGHDVVFLLMDTRESRWLPTVIGAAKRKIVVNTALGFESFLVLRHGVRSESVDVGAVGPAPGLTGPAPGLTGPAPSLTGPVPGSELGCYFCNDVVAPGDSTRDRTLDQQCTVSRPGMSMMASALAVELAASVLLHPKRGLAAAASMQRDDGVNADTMSPLGIVPHQMRGFLSRFEYIMPTCRAFDKCTACSEHVLDAYSNEGFDFLLKVFNEPHFLEDLTGLTQMQMEVLDGQIMELSDDDSLSS